MLRNFERIREARRTEPLSRYTAARNLGRQKDIATLVGPEFVECNAHTLLAIVIASGVDRSKSGGKCGSDSRLRARVVISARTTRHERHLDAICERHSRDIRGWTWSWTRTQRLDTRGRTPTQPLSARPCVVLHNFRSLPCPASSHFHNLLQALSHTCLRWQRKR